MVELRFFQLRFWVPSRLRSPAPPFSAINLTEFHLAQCRGYDGSKEQGSYHLEATARAGRLEVKKYSRRHHRRSAAPQSATFLTTGPSAVGSVTEPPLWHWDITQPRGLRNSIGCQTSDELRMKAVTGGGRSFSWPALLGTAAASSWDRSRADYPCSLATMARSTCGVQERRAAGSRSYGKRSEESLRPYF